MILNFNLILTNFFNINLVCNTTRVVVIMKLNITVIVYFNKLGANINTVMKKNTKVMLLEGQVQFIPI